MRTRRSGMGRTGILALLAALCTAAPAAADWKMFRHDAARTALAPLATTINRPAPLWRYYLGGTLGPEQYWAGDADGDGTAEVIFVAGGKLIAKLPNDTIVWDTPPLDLTRLLRVADLDGDGRTEIVAASDSGDAVLIFADDGALLWQSTAGIFGTYGVAARFADFDADGADDMYAAASWASDQAYVFSFASGAATPTQLFRLETGRRDYVIDGNDALGDFNGDGRPEVLVQGHRIVYLYSGADGHLLGQTADIGGIPYGSAVVNVEDVDGDGADEAVLFVDSAYDITSISRRVFLLEWDGTAGTLVRRWQMSATDLTRDQHLFQPYGTADLDADGFFEVVTSFRDGAAARTTLYVLDARDGTIVDSVTDAAFSGLADIDDDGRPEVLATNAAGALSAFALVARSLDWRWTLADRLVPAARDPVLGARQTGCYRPVPLDADGDARSELLLTVRNVDGDVTELFAYDAELAAPVAGSSYAFASGTVPLTYQAFPDISGPGEGPQVALARSDGYLVVLGRDLVPLNEPTGEQAGLRIGGFYSGARGYGSGPPIATDLEGDTVVDVVVRNSRGALVRLDPVDASLAVEPLPVWERPREIYPNAVDLNADGALELVVGTTPTTPSTPYRVRVLSAGGTAVLWEQAVTGANEYLAYDVLPAGDLTGDGRPDLLYEKGSNADSMQRANVLSGVDGAAYWPTPFERSYAGCGFGGIAAADLTGDGIPDPLLPVSCGPLQMLNPRTGAVVNTVDGGLSNLASAFDVDGDTQPEAVAQGTWHHVIAWRRDFSLLWQETPDRMSYGVYGAFAPCPAPTGVRYVQGSVDSPTLSIWNAATGARAHELVLAGGAAWATVADALAAGARPGFLGNATAKADLAGTGTPGVLVGSTDGYLYAINPCAGTVAWSLFFRYPVGESIFADVSDDGSDDILVSVADGYLYAVTRERFRAPAEVLDTDPPGGFPAEDRDTIETLDTLYASWTAVPAATSYEYAVVTPSGSFVTRPDFVNIGTATTATASGLGLRLGGTYTFAVRAIGPGGSSAETLSDGIRVVDETLPTITLLAAPNPFSPDGDGTDDTMTIVADMDDRVGLDSWSLVVFHPGGLAVARTFASRPLAGLSASDFLEWDGTYDGGGVLPESVYPARATVRDGSGHARTETIELEIRFAPTADADADADGDVPAEAEAEAGADATTDADADSSAEALAEADAPPPDVPGDVTDGPGPDGGGDGGGGGCGCRATGAGRPAWLSPLLAIPVIVLAFGALRRRRSPRA